MLEVEGRSVRVTHPGKLYFSRETTLTKIELVRYYLAVAAGSGGGDTGSAGGAEAVCEWGGGGAVLSEAGAGGPAGVAADGDAEFSFGADGG